MNDHRETHETEFEPKTPSDARVLLAPLGRYALIALLIVATIVTTAIMLDDQLNSIDREVASLKAELEKANEMEQAVPESRTEAVQAVGETEAQGEKIKLEDTRPVINIIKPSTVMNDTENSTASATEDSIDEAEAELPGQTPAGPYAEAPAPPAPAFYPVPPVAYVPPAFITGDRYFGDRIAADNAFMQERLAQREQMILENRAFREAMQREYMQNLHDYQQQRFEEMERHLQEIHDRRAATIQRRQEERYRVFPDSI